MMGSGEEESWVSLPTSADHAAAMANLGMAWLKQHAPERLKDMAALEADAARMNWMEAHRDDVVFDVQTPEKDSDEFFVAFSWWDGSAFRSVMSKSLRDAIDYAMKSAKEKP